ncbi:MAG: hypothetical protein LBQ38_02545 [Spirochaetaceae bacterium]|nr:hypothetical protein [Spirochaetaceae bacterium]
MIGTWEFTGAYGTEAYKITDDTIQYGNGAGTAFVSTFEAKIHEVAYHTGEKDSGILYIEYTTKKPQYYSYGPAPDYTQTGGPFDPSGDFTAVLFHELKTAAGVTTIKLCNPYKASDTHEAIGTDGSTTVRFTASEVGSLAAAKQKFTTDTESEYVAWSGVSAQTRVN